MAEPADLFDTSVQQCERPACYVGKELYVATRSLLLHREVFFESNGVPRVVEVVDKKSYESDTSKFARRPARDKADPLLPGSVAAPMAGEVIEVKVKPGAALASARALYFLDIPTPRIMSCSMGRAMTLAEASLSCGGSHKLH